MTIENIINIIGGQIVNNPKVQKVESATIYPSKVELGDLFFATNHDDIPKVIQKGAYAIVFEGDIPKISDEEIVYIQVDSIKEATLKFLRYVTIQKESKIYLFKDIEISLLKQITFRKSKVYTILSDDWKKNFETILNSDYEIFITNNKDIAKTISPNYHIVEDLAQGYIISDSLLKTTFKLEKYVYQDLEIPPFFIENLRKVVAFCKEYNIAYDINRIKYTKEFKPYFVDKNLNILPRGSSDRVLIFTYLLSVVNDSIEYLKKEGRWIKRLTLTPPKVKLESNDKPRWYSNIQEAKEILKNEHFHYAFCYNLKPEEILNKDSSNINLFD